MNTKDPVAQRDAPKPSAAEVKQSLATVMAKPSRPGHLALLLFSLCGAGVAVALLATEPALPLRTKAALSMLALIGLAWVTFACWTLLRGGALLGWHSVVAARMAVGFSTVFALGVVALGLTQELPGQSRRPWYAAMSTGLLMIAISALMLRRSQSRFRELSNRRAMLEQKLKSLSGAALVMLLLLTLKPADSNAQSASATNSDASVKEGMFTVGGQPMAVIEGRFRVRANRTSNSTGMLTLAYVQFKSTSVAPRAPIVFLAGGPGDAATRALAGMPRSLLDELLSIADVIAFDQRGTGRSQPINPFCAPGEFLARDRSGDPDVFLSVLRVRVQTCLGKAATDGVDIQGLTTLESADDIDELRRALGVSKVMLLAGSYGTHLALATAKRYPDSIDRMVLAGVEGLDDTFKLPSRVDAVLDAIAKSKRPTLVADLRTLRSRLKTEPARFTFPAGQVLALGEWDLQRWVSESLDAVPKTDAMLAGVAAMLDGNYTALGSWALGYRVPKPLGLMHLAMDCASYATAGRLKQIADEARTSVLGNAINFPFPGICDVPGVPRLPDSYRGVFTAPVPSLLVSGTFDGRTPPQNAIDAARNLPNARQLVIDGASHGLFREAKVNEAMLQFFREVR